MLRWRIGDILVTRILETEFGPLAGPDFSFPLSTPEAVSKIPWLGPPFVDKAGMIFLSFHALLVETPKYRILVDTCFGNDKQRGMEMIDNFQTPFLEDFEKTGVKPDDVDFVVCTHLHVDHIGWNTRLVDGKWVPTFRNARTLMGRKEFEYWHHHEGDELHRIAFADSVQPLWDAGLIDLVESDHQICPEVQLEPTPGHTVGHVSVRLRSGGQEALITGDFVHHPMQMAHPEWGIGVDYDGKQSEQTRRRVFSDCADRDLLMIGTHFMAPTGVRVRRDETAFRIDAGAQPESDNKPD